MRLELIFDVWLSDGTMLATPMEQTVIQTMLYAFTDLHNKQWRLELNTFSSFIYHWNTRTMLYIFKKP